MTIDLKNLRAIALASAAVTAAVQTATAAVGLPRGRRDYADAVWGPGLAAIAVTSAAVGKGDRVRRWTLAATTTAWATRLGHQMVQRMRRSDGEDGRYGEYLQDASTGEVIRKVFVTQGLAQLLVSAPIQMAAASPLPSTARRWLFPAGAALMVVGGIIEALADHQKAQYKELDKDQRPEVLDTGLWGWSRHPNYFGDSVVWDGAFVAATASPGALWTAPAPVAMNWFLMVATGAKRTERLMQDRPGYRDYQRRVSFFFPRPPTARASRTAG